MSTEFDDDDPLENRNRAADLERIKQARKKRISQLKSWQQYDKLMEKNKLNSVKPKISKRNIHFPQSLVLLEAAGRGDIDEVSQILSDGGSPDVCNEDGLTALHQCCIDNNVDICRLLLQHGVNVNATDSELWTPLHAAAACAHIDICAALIESGAELLAMNAEGNMPYDICEEENTLDLIENAMAIRGISQDDIDEKRRVPELNMLQDLTSNASDLTKLDTQGANYLHIASSCGYLDVGRFLLDSGVAVDVLDKDGWQPLHVAACWGQLEFIELLLLRGADINSATVGGETIYDICEDPEMNQKLMLMKEEIERQHEIRKTVEIKPSLSMLNRRSISSKRSTSIRRSSMKEKSLMSWKEARQEALIKEAVKNKISTDVTTGHGVASDKAAGGDELLNGSNDKEIDISEVLLDVQIVTENELLRKEPFMRRGSSRNSFTHSHPYHSPSRDPTLLEGSLQEEPNTVIEPKTDRTSLHPPAPSSSLQNTNSARSSQRSGKNASPNRSEIGSEISKKPQPVSTVSPPNNPSFTRKVAGGGATNAADISSVRSSNRPTAANSVDNQPKPKKEIDNRIINKSQKTQGCCMVM